MAETITLPKSGIVLEWDVHPFKSECGFFARFPGGGLASIVPSLGDTWVGWMNYIGSGRGSRDEAVAWLDAKILALRAALLPHDARERVARWLWSYSSVPIQHRTECVEGSCWFRDADNLLAALGGQP